ncbi:hypothetical protein ABT061_15630 [Streptosporangium sp. NPDC002544]|uniref:hypothetical protein n=1 Tax=Streptosporangium sp. NPDC002544 TaxID=3154538 RepID=UPI003327F8F6
MSAPALEAVTKLAARQVLAGAADVLDRDYPAARLTAVTLTGALRQAALHLLPDAAMSDIYQLAYDAGDVLGAHLRSRGADPALLLERWSTPHATAEVIEDLRAAANTTTESGDQA